MFVRTLKEIRDAGMEKVLADGQVRSARFLTADDGLGFTLSDVRLKGVGEQECWYKNHWEANYIVSGHAVITDLTHGDSFELNAGTLYMVGPRDRHKVVSDAGLHIVCIFNPPLKGDEAHDKDGAYPPTGPVPYGHERMFLRTVEQMRADGLEKVVASGSARTLRMLTKADDLGFTVSDVNLKAGNKNTLWYKNHWEANYILDGEGEVSDLTTGEAWKMEPGMMYCVGPKDRHSMHAHTDLHLISVFNPALAGDEMHDEDGALAPSGPIPPGPAAPS